MPNTKGDDVRQITIQKLVSGGYGLGEFEGKKGFIRGAYPGELVLARVIEDKKNLWFGEVEEILQASAHRRKSPCAYSQECGGCPWIDLAEGAQREGKIQILQETLARLGGITLQEEEIMVLEGAPFQYRSRAQVHWDGEHLGFKARRSGAVVPIHHCEVLTPGMDSLWEDESLGLKARPRSRVLECDSGPLSEGRGTITLLGKSLSVDAQGFFQSNRQVQEKLLHTLKERLSGESLVDLYGGVGAFAAVLAPNFRKIWLVESHQPSAACARENLKSSGAKVFSGTAEAWSRSYPKITIDWVIVDPPRTGLKGRVLSLLLQKKTRNIAYVSCNPDTQARDLKALTSGGYRLQEAFLLDFYPQTPHIETLMILTQNHTAEQNQPKGSDYA
jgi:23S rRNA (uracil1939-C5)-methyltransferase